MQVPINTGTSEALGFYWLQYRHCFENSIKTFQVLLFLQLLFHIKYCNTKRCSLSGFPPSIQSAHIHTLVKDSKYMAISYISYDRNVYRSEVPSFLQRAGKAPPASWQATDRDPPPAAARPTRQVWNVLATQTYRHCVHPRRFTGSCK